jgi:hypothetical protein
MNLIQDNHKLKKVNQLQSISYLLVFSGSYLMWSLIIFSFSLCDQIDPDWLSPNNLSTLYEIHLLATFG